MFVFMVNLVLILYFLHLQLRNEVGKIDGKLRVTQNVLEHRVGQGLSDTFWNFTLFSRLNL